MCMSLNTYIVTCIYIVHVVHVHVVHVHVHVHEYHICAYVHVYTVHMYIHVYIYTCMLKVVMVHNGMGEFLSATLTRIRLIVSCSLV